MKKKVFGHHIFAPTEALQISRRIEVNLLKSYLDVQPSDLLCDIGCGNGYWMEKLAGGATTVGVDIEQDALLVARAYFDRPHLHYCISNAEHMALPAEHFDKIYGICSVEHIPGKAEAFSEFCRCLKPQGVLALTLDSLNHPSITPEKRQHHAEKYSVAHFYDIENTRETLEQAGFDLTDYRYIISSPLANWMYAYIDKMPRLQYVTFPISYPLTLLSESLSGSPNYGWKLAIRAVKK